jgi:hypothetical protein
VLLHIAIILSRTVYTVIDLLHAVLRTENGAHQADKLPLKFRLCIACYRGSDKERYFRCGINKKGWTYKGVHRGCAPLLSLVNSEVQ